jgi:hypothetical protein
MIQSYRDCPCSQISQVYKTKRWESEPDWGTRLPTK